MKVTIHSDAQGWTLRVDGREVIVGESFAIVDAVRDELNRPGSGIGEIREVADAIRKAAGVQP